MLLAINFLIRGWGRRLHLVLPAALIVSLFVAIVLLLPLGPEASFSASSMAASARSPLIWDERRQVDWRPCAWWRKPKALPAPLVKSNGYLRIDCYGGLNQLRRDLCDGIAIARLLNATMVLPKFEVAAYWNESSDFSDVFDVDYFIKQTKGHIEVLKELPAEIASREPFKVDCSKRKGHFDYVEMVLPALLEHHYISLTPAASQRSDRIPMHVKAAYCQGCYLALRLRNDVEQKAESLLRSIPRPFLALHLRFEPDMVAYSRCLYPDLSPASELAIESARDGKKPLTGDAARVWRNRGKCPLTPKETALVLQALGIPSNTTIYLAAGDGLMEIEGFTSLYTNVYTKSSLLSKEDFKRMHGNTKAAIDYHVSVNSDAYVATYFGNMDKVVTAMRTMEGRLRTLILSRRAFANYMAAGLQGKQLGRAMWIAHRDDYVTGRGYPLPDCFCEFKL